MTVAVSTPDDRLEAVFRRRYAEIAGLARRVLGDRAEAEDVAQETFAKLARHPVLHRPDDEVAAWLRRVAVNASFNRARGRRRAKDVADRAARLEPAPAAEDAGSQLATVVRREEQTLVRAALASLPERQRACLLLRHSGYRYREIAEALGLAVGSVGVLLSRAERAFRATYEESNRERLS